MLSKRLEVPSLLDLNLFIEYIVFVIIWSRYRLERNVLKQFLDNHNLPFNERTNLNPPKNIKNKIDRLLIIYIKKSKIVV